ncbi:hypothetical protein BAUCODRAFT_39834 [Baudoinia panamericana UAMH 10762]|uniref:Uncharacterized protein n=1 Tax=Baudoinia panamericana (strain UAMH 10762) TaxID=717646 RepID=M2M2S4_BAUPA|nr:uncharacterized protein BAUCODRAFT_39834 [Baudoinia panamericana UAMH 10762]EMC90826.1 hypothetical protein BAUCODRAFT_39834 [Baudoinia panamericana UAMH 10762]
MTTKLTIVALFTVTLFHIRCAGAHVRQAVREYVIRALGQRIEKHAAPGTCC